MVEDLLLDELVFLKNLSRIKQRFEEGLEKKIDSKFVNHQNGFGVLSHSNSTSLSIRRRISYQELDVLSRQNGLFHKIISAKVEDMLRDWVEISCKGDNAHAEAELLEEFFEEISLKSYLKELFYLSRLYGGAVLFFHFDDVDIDDSTSYATPVYWKNVTKVLKIHVVSRIHAFPNSWDSYGGVSTYQVNLTRGQWHRTFPYVHHSRVIRAEGDFLTEEQRSYYQGWGDSFAERFIDELQAYKTSHQAIADTLQEYFQFVLKTKMPQDLKARDIKRIRKKMQMMRMENSSRKTSVVDIEDEFDIKSIPTQGLVEVLESFRDSLSAAARYPKSRLYSSETGNLKNSTSDSDLRYYYDDVMEDKISLLVPILNQVTEMYKKIFRKESLKFRFIPKPLFQPTDKEKAETTNIYSDAATKLVINGIYAPEEIRESLNSGDKFQLRSIEEDSKAYKDHLDYVRRSKFGAEESQGKEKTGLEEQKKQKVKHERAY